MISVIVPIYNVEKYLPRCIESIMAQTYADIEIILVDDGSPDGCPAICDAYAEKDGRIVVVHQQNGGVSAARNAGLRIAKGEYIGFVDPDDWIAPEMYESMLKAMEQEQADLAICGYDYYDENGNADEKRRYPVRSNEVVSQKQIRHRLTDILPSIRYAVWNQLFKKSILGSTVFPVYIHFAEDVWFLDEYVFKIRNAVIVHQPWYRNCVRVGSATHGGVSIDSLADSFSAHDRVYADTVKLYPELKNQAQAFLLDYCLLKYREAKGRTEKMCEKEKAENAVRLHEMRRYIQTHAWKALLNKEIYWKTRIAYLLCL